ncbi:metallophosphoesterase [Pseudomonas sp.]|uniref:metallophosphoesterase n=1 Tax=Pseudomonas sp. TaxID=306 RepID=UPI00272A9840|nr:metallophosphoesterase [Pseudomonas sp.]
MTEITPITQSDMRLKKSQRIHVLSDLHVEFEGYAPAELDADIVVLAGDIGVKEMGVVWANNNFRCPVVYVPGNHDFYGGHLQHTLEKMRKAAAPHVHVLDCDQMDIYGVRFLGATAWTDFASTGNAQKASLAAEAGMQDFKSIRTDRYRRIKPKDLVLKALHTRRWLQSELMKPFDGPTVIVTHHAPSLLSIQGSRYAGGMLDAAFANSWDDLMGPSVELWLHGHTHFPVDYQIKQTRVVSNPRGYPGELEHFNPHLIIELNTADQRS